VGIFASSSAFVGRSAELAALQAAYRDENVTTVLVSGESGIGKSRLVQEFTTRLGAAPLVLTGRCMEFGNDGLPFAPFLSPLRRLAVEPGDFGEVLAVVERCADARPLVLVLEDLHWADRSSLRLLTFLVANLAHDGVFLVGTHRAADGPLRPLVAELARSPAVRRVAPPALSRHETVRQLASLLGRKPEPVLASRVFERSRGNPLFVEALSGSPEDTPAELHELLLAGLPELDADGHRVLSVAAVAGTEVEHGVLAAVSELPEPRLEPPLRLLVDKHVLLATGAGGYSFVHALVRHAVYERLLPVERTRLHARFTESFTAVPQRAAELAVHARAAGLHEVAVAAAWEAAGRAGRCGGEPERLRLLEGILEQWEVAGGPPGVDRLTVLDHAVEASLATSAVESGRRWCEEALAVAPHPRRFYQRALLRNLGREGGLDDLHTALELLPEPTPLRGRILTDLAVSCMFTGDAGEGERHARAALEIAGTLGDASLLARAHAYLGLAAGTDPQAARDHFAAARRTTDPQTIIDVATWESAFCVAMGDYERAIEVVQVGLTSAHGSFQYAKHAPILVVKWVQALTARGRWAEALDRIDETLGESDLPQLSGAALHISRGEVHLAQGDPGRAGSAAEAAARLLGNEPWTQPYRLRLRALRIRLDPEADRTFDRAELAEHPHEAWRLLGAVRPAELPDLPAVGPVDEAYRAMARGDDAAAARAWRALGQPFELSLCTGRAEPAAPPRAPASGPAGLTAREREVLGLVAEGKSNRQIAAELFISSNTAGVHVSRILAKLRVANRTEAARKLHDAAIGA
jgi:DNA-binding CsgD family transcriptional regulator